MTRAILCILMVLTLPLGFAAAADPPPGKLDKAAGVQISIVARFISLTPALLRDQKLELP
jgi:hypothetical protein